MTQWVTVKKNGKKRAVPVGSPRKGYVGYTKHLTQREMNDLRKVGINHPGSLTSLGYHINLPATKRRIALAKAEKKYGYKETLRKLGELYRLDYNKPSLRSKIVDDIRFIRKGKKGPSHKRVE